MRNFVFINRAAGAKMIAHPYTVFVHAVALNAGMTRWVFVPGSQKCLSGFNQPYYFIQLQKNKKFVLCL